MSGRCTGDRRVQKRQGALGGKAFYRAAAVHRERHPWTRSGELVERGGGQGRIRPTALQVADVEATSGDTRRRPQAVGCSRLEAATVRERTVARSRAPEWLARLCPRCSGRVRLA